MYHNGKKVGDAKELNYSDIFMVKVAVCVAWMNLRSPSFEKDTDSRFKEEREEHVLLVKT